jgi:hypothetical protein
MKRVPVDGLGQRKYAVRRDWRDTPPPSWITSDIHDRIALIGGVVVLVAVIVAAVGIPAVVGHHKSQTFYHPRSRCRSQAAPTRGMWQSTGWATSTAPITTTTI